MKNMHGEPLPNEEEEGGCIIFTMDEWRQAIESGGYVPDDGVGYYHDGTNYYRAFNCWSSPVPDIAKGVVWFNK